jgi:hypothetical protein
MTSTLRIELTGSSTDHHVQKVASSFSASDREAVRNLALIGSIRHGSMTSHSITLVHNLLSMFPNVQSLCFQSLSVFGTSHDYEYFAGAMRQHPKVSSVDINGCNPSELEPTSSLAPFLTALSGAPKLTVLSIRHTMISSLGFRTRDALIAFLRTSTSSSALRSLSLKLIPELCDDHLAQIIDQAIKPHPFLEVLSIESYNLGLATCSALASTLVANRRLRSLRLSLCPSLDHVLPIIQALQSPQATSLEELVFHVDFLSQRIGDRRNFLEAVQTMLYSNSTLKDIRGLDWDAEYQTIPFYLELNRLGREKLLRSSEAKEWVEALAASHTNVRFVYYLLSANPSLLSQPVPSSL